MVNKEKVLREKLKKAINRVFDLFCEYEAQFGDYTPNKNDEDLQKIDALKLQKKNNNLKLKSATKTQIQKAEKPTSTTKKKINK